MFYRRGIIFNESLQETPAALPAVPLTLGAFLELVQTEIRHFDDPSRIDKAVGSFQIAVKSERGVMKVLEAVQDVAYEWRNKHVVQFYFLVVQNILQQMILSLVPFDTCLFVCSLRYLEASSGAVFRDDADVGWFGAGTYKGVDVVVTQISHLVKNSFRYTLITSKYAYS